MRLSHHFKDGKKIYDAADTGLFGDMQLIGEEGIDLAILPIGDNYTMGPDDAVRAVKLLQPRQGVADPLQHFPAHSAGRRGVGRAREAGDVDGSDCAATGDVGGGCGRRRRFRNLR